MCLNLEGIVWCACKGSEAKSDGWDRPWKSDPHMCAERGKRSQESVAVSETLGRFPSHVIIDGSDAVLEEFAKAGNRLGASGGGPKEVLVKEGVCIPSFNSKILTPDLKRSDSGSAARFFYCAKSSPSERNKNCDNLPQVISRSGLAGAMPIDDAGKERDRFSVRSRNHHPTVKSIALMKYLIKLVTPMGVIVLDPFMGSGSTGVAALEDGFSFIGIEKETEYFEICKARLGIK